MKNPKSILLAVLALIGLSIGACSSNPPTENTVLNAKTELLPKSNSKVGGEILFSQTGESVHVSGKITGLKPNTIHGFHIHEYGDCTASDGSSAGGHFNPDGHKHGGPKDEIHHAGDLGNITADKNGTAFVDVDSKSISLNSKMPNSVVGKAVIVHKKVDEFSAQPSGNAGARIACGLITQ